MKTVGLLVAFFVILSILTGCWDKKEVEELSYVVAIGLDVPKGVDIENDQAVDVTFQFSNPKENTGGGQGGENKGIGAKEENVITLTSPDVVTAKNTANSFITRQVSFDHIRAIIVSEELARSDFFLRILSSALKEREIRRESTIIVSEGRASEFIEKNKPEMKISPHKYYQFMLQRSVETGMVPSSNVNRFFQITDADGDLFLAMLGSIKGQNLDSVFREEDHYLAGQVPKKGGNPAQIMGSAVFKEGKMIAKLTGEETRLSLLLDNTSNIKDMFVIYKDPLKEKYKIGARVRKKTATEVKIKLRNGPPKIDVILPIELEILSVPSMINYGNDLKKQQFLKQSVKSDVEKKIKELIVKTQEEFKSEPFYWSLHARPLFSSVKEYESWDWTNKNYPYADIRVKVDVKIIGFGKQMKESELEKVKD